MIYTLTLAPSLDYVMECDSIKIGQINRSKNEEYYPGGKGINVSIVLKKLGMDSKALGFIGGFTGEYIKKSLNKMNISHEFVNVDGNSRINVKIKGAVETAINGIGPRVSIDYYGDLMLILNTLEANDFLILSGSVIKDFSYDIYEKIMIFLKNRNINIIVDTYGEALMSTLKWHPFLVKPNIYELCELFDIKINNFDELKKAASRLIELGAKNAIVSLGEFGALFINNDGELIYDKGYKGHVKNTVGAGDAMVAGFVYSYIMDKDLKKAFAFSVASGCAAAFNETMPEKQEILSLIE